MNNSYFQFKRFRVEHSRSAMKVGTDGVLLGAWCSVRQTDRHVLDVGAGTGLVSLMVAQRAENVGFSPRIDSVEIDQNSYEDATLNFKNSVWHSQLNALNISLQEFVQQPQLPQYDHIVSNPPFFQNSLASPNYARTTARHTSSLSYADLVVGVSKLLAEDGLFSVILPVVESGIFIQLAVEQGFILSRRTLVCPTVGSEPKRVLMEFSRTICELIEDKFAIESTTRHNYTDQYIGLTQDFYLKF